MKPKTLEPNTDPETLEPLESIRMNSEALIGKIKRSNAPDKRSTIQKLQEKIDEIDSLIQGEIQ